MRRIFCGFMASSVVLASSALAGGKDYPHEYYPRRYASDDEAAVTVKPDTLTFSVSVARGGPDAAALVPQVQALFGDVVDRVKTATGGEVVLRMQGLRVFAPGDKPKDPLRTVSASAELYLPLSPQQDYWARAQLLAKAWAALRLLDDENKDPKKATEFSFSGGAATVRDPEQARAELIAQWVERAKAFATAAQSAQASLHLLHCAPPGDVQQRSVDLMTVQLALKQTCTLEAVGK